MKNTDLLLFPETISFYKLKIKDKKINNFLKKLNFIKSDSNDINLYKTKENNILNNMLELKKQILFCCNDYLNNKFKLNIKFKIVDSWATLTKKNGFSTRHYHPHSFLSGVFYPSVKEKTEIRFYKKYQSDFWALDPLNYNIFNSESWKISTENNDLILFKSYLEHEIVNYQGNENRYSISFNVIPIGDLGNTTYKISL
jgi:uncharacterized protein (TIGR02466 family)